MIKVKLKEAKNKFSFENPLAGKINIGVNRKNYSFNLKDIVEYISKNYSVQEVDPNIFKDQISGVIEDPEDEQERIKKANLDYPVAVVRHDNDKYIIVDGTHRIRKAMQEKVKVKAYIVPFEDLKDIKKQIGASK
jgi:hypothetical protein